jgi:hypothetical protein
VGTIETLALRAGFEIDPISGNGATGYADVLHYLKAVDDLLGRQAWISAKLNITNRMRDLGLLPDLRPVPSGVRPGAPADTPTDAVTPHPRREDR